MAEIILSEYVLDSDGQQYIWNPEYQRHVAIKKEFWVDIYHQTQIFSSN